MRLKILLFSLIAAAIVISSCSCKSVKEDVSFSPVKYSQSNGIPIYVFDDLIHKRLSQPDGIEVKNDNIFSGFFLYVLPDKSWVTNEFLNDLKFAQKSTGDIKYNYFNNNCQDFTRFGVWFANFLHSITYECPAGHLAVAEFLYIPDGQTEMEGHAIILFLTKRDIIFIEPQDCTIKELSPSEKKNCIFIRF